jgi:hypothetical protein
MKKNTIGAMIYYMTYGISCALIFIAIVIGVASGG